MRVTVSALHHVPLGARGIWATTLAYGSNHTREIVSGGTLLSTSAPAVVASSTRELAPCYAGRAAPGLAVFFNLQAARHRM